MGDLAELIRESSYRLGPHLVRSTNSLLSLVDPWYSLSNFVFFERLFGGGPGREGQATLVHCDPHLAAVPKKFVAQLALR